MKHVAIYIRVSTEEQATQGNSLEEQEERLRAYCKAMGWDNVDTFIDDGYSAGTLNRPYLSKMIDGVKENKYSMVITTKIDRLCRNLLDLLTLIDEFETYKCGYASSSESFDTSTPAGRMVLQILGAFAEFERGRTRERIRDNMRSIARKTDRALSRPCFGYDVIDGKYVVNEKEAEIVKQIADWMIAGEGALKVAKRLNKIGILTKDGNSFTANAVRKLVRRETLYGTLVYNRVTTHKGKQITRPKEEWIITENHHESVLDKQTFDKMQTVIDARTTSGKQADNQRWLLSGIVICDHCGKKMVGRYKKKPSGREYFHYVCTSYTRKAECFHHYIKRDDLEQVVLDALLNLGALAPGSFGELLEETPFVDELDIKQLEDKLKKLDSKMQKQIELFEDDEITKDDFRLARDRIETSREQLREQLRSATESNSAIAQGKFIDLVDELKSDIQSNNRAAMKNALRQLINRVEIRDGSKVDIKFRLNT